MQNDVEAGVSGVDGIGVARMLFHTKDSAFWPRKEHTAKGGFAFVCQIDLAHSP